MATNSKENDNNSYDPTAPPMNAAPPPYYNPPTQLYGDPVPTAPRAPSLYPDPIYPTYQSTCETNTYPPPGRQAPMPSQCRPTPTNQTPLLPQITTKTQYIMYDDNDDRRIHCLGNLLWFIFAGGFVFFLVYGILGLLLCCTIVGIPFGLQLFKLADLCARAFGREIARPNHKRDCCHCIGNLLWLPVGVSLALIHLCYATAMCLTIIGIPFALPHMKLAEIALWPFGSNMESHTSGYEVITTSTMV